MANSSVNYITKRQIKKIHALKNRLGWSDEQYREYLMTEGDGFAMSCKDLSEDEAERLIRKMELIAVAKGVWERYESRNKYEELKGREGMATPEQLRKIDALWKEVSRAKDEKTRGKGLRALLQKRFRVSDLRFLEEYQVKKVIKMLQAMKQNGGKRQ